MKELLVNVPGSALFSVGISTLALAHSEEEMKEKTGLLETL